MSQKLAEPAGLGVTASTVARLGLGNVARVAGYRTALRFPASRIRRLAATNAQGPFFAPTEALARPLLPLTTWQDTTLLFGYAESPVSEGAPGWHVNPLTDVRVPGPERPWWAIPDFDPAVGDIKGVWELSRFDWVLAFAERARQGDMPSLCRLNTWLADWSEQNPPYRGPNWKCGQEASIRVMHLAMAAVILAGDRRATNGLLELVGVHLKRIAPTTSYAVGQANNHGTSEAAALFIGGTWLDAPGAKWARAGRALLEDRVARLIFPDGGFSQYSVNYHRVVLDTLCMVEVWRRRIGEDAFSARFYERARAATEWLRRLTNGTSGDAPNTGANDGAKLLRVTDADYRDHRPTVQLSALLFLNGRAYDHGPWDDAATWLDVSTSAPILPPPVSAVGEDCGFAVIRRRGALAILRHPRFRFRPSQSDLLHLDLWVGEDNVLRDGGSYSYNTSPEQLRYFSGVASHNTVEFDGRDQMPRLGRFLFGGWPRGEILEPLTENSEAASIGVAYRDIWGARHERRVSLTTGSLRVQDNLSGFASRAVLRWRLRPGAWRLSGQTVTDGQTQLRVASSAPIRRFELVTGWEARRYLEMTELPVLEVEVSEPAALTSECAW